MIKLRHSLNSILTINHTALRFLLTSRNLWVQLLIFITLSASVDAQVAQIGTGTTLPVNTNYGPVYRFSATSTTTQARADMLYTAAEMATAGIPAGAQITAVEFYKGNAGYFTTPATHKMYVANTSNTALATTLTWASVLSTHTLVYSTTSLTLPNTAGWVMWTFSSPFTYTGGAFEVATDLTMGASGAASDTIKWQFTGTSGADISKLVGATGTTSPTTLNGSVSAYRNRPNIRITYTAGGCTTPPVPGIANASPSTPQCIGTTVSLGLTGNSSGAGQTYVWQSSPTSGGTFTDVSPVSNGPTYNVTVNSSLYYRCAVTCSGNTQYSTEVFVQLNPPFPAGTYTINNNLPTGGGNFNSYTDAVNALSCGIAGPVVFNVDPASGPYTEQVIIPPISGTSSTNTVTFNGNGRTIQATPVSATRAIFRLSGADYIVLNNISMKTLDGTYGWGVHLTGGADYNTISNCTIDVSTSTTTTEASNIGILSSNSTTAAASSGVNASNVSILNNTIIGGVTGIYLYQASATPATGNLISGNTIRDFYGDGISLTYQDGTIISGNNIYRSSRVSTTTFTGVTLGTGNKNCVINANRIHDTHNSASSQSGAAYGVFADGCDAPSGSPNKVTNNLLYNFNSTTGTVYGFYNSGSDGIYYYHNTISLDHPGATSGTTRGIYQTTAATDIQIRNNIITITRGGTGAKNCLYFGTTTSTISSNNNDLYINTAGTSGVGYYSSNQVTLANWQSVNGSAYDQASISENPLYSSPSGGDFTPTVTPLNNQGAPVGVLADINNTARSLSTPDQGAYEFDLLGLDAELEWVSPVNPGATGSASVTVRINNVQAQTISSVQLAYAVGTTVVTETFPVSIAPGGNQQLTFSTPYNVIGATYFKAYIQSVNNATDAVQANDTVTYTYCVPLPAGTYTINSAVATGGSNFQTFADVSFVLGCGIAGPVVFNVDAASGPYVEQVILPVIPNASSTNTITFNGNGRTVSYTNTNTNERGIIKLNGSDYVTLNNFVIETPGTYGIGVLLNNNADFNTVSGCTFNLNMNATATNYSGISISNTAASSTATGANGCDNNTFIGNTIIGGYYGITIVGLNTGPIQNNVVIGNTIKDFYQYGIYVNGTNNTLIEGNNIFRETRPTVITFNGIYFTAASTNASIQKNRIHDPQITNTSSTSSSYGINFSSCDATAGNENRVFNNLIYNFASNGIQNGILNTGSAFVKYYHNTIAFNDPASATSGTDGARGFYQTTAATDITFRNNIISINRGGSADVTCLYFNTATSTIVCDNNDLYIGPAGTGSKNYGYYNGTFYTSLGTWQTANSNAYDFSSVNSNPTFVNAAGGNYMPGEITVNNIGAPVGVLSDILGAVRSTTNPDPGAYEFDVSPFDVGLTVMTAPNNGGCYSAAQNVSVTVKNYGSASLNFASSPATVTVNVTGAITATLTYTINSGILAPGATQSVTVSPLIDMTGNGTYMFNASISMSGDASAANDAIAQTSRTVGVIPGSISASETEFCVSGTPAFTLTGVYGGQIQWQQTTDSTSGWTNVGVGNLNYTPSSAYTQNTFVRAVVSCNTNSIATNTINIIVNSPQLLSTTPATRCGLGTVTLGATSNAGAVIKWYGSSTGGASLFTGNNFTTPVINSSTTYYAAAVEGSTNVYAGRLAPQAGAATVLSTYGQVIVLTQSTTLKSVQVISTTGTAITVSLYNSTGATQLFTTGSNTVSTNSTTTINLNWALSPGTYRLCANAMTGNFIRENSTVTYPIALADIGQVTGFVSSITATTVSTTASYYWFYNMQFSVPCEGGRQPVTATVTPAPVIDAVATNPAICAGSSSDISVNSANANYSYSWTSSPAGFTASGAGPHNVTPSVTTKYYVLATDNTAGGADSGCVTVDSVTVVAGTTLSAGTIAASQTNLCVSETPTFTATGAGGGLLTWQVSTTSATGPWANVSNSNPYIPSVPITQSSWYRLKVSCDIDSVFSNTVAIVVNNPQVTSTTPGSRCGIGTVQLSATAGVNDSINWYASPTAPLPLATGSTFTTPVISSTTDFYVSAGSGNSNLSTGLAAPPSSPSSGSGTTNYGLVFDVFTPCVLNTVVIYPVSASSASGTVTIDVINGSGTVVHTVTVNVTGSPVATPVPVTVPLYFNLMPGTNYKMRPGFTGISGLLFGPASAAPSGNYGYPFTIPGVLSITTSTYAVAPAVALHPELYYYFFNWSVTTGCQGTRVPVTATVVPADPITVTAGQTTLCSGQSTTLSVSSPNPNYTYTWMPGNLTGPVQTVTPSGTVKYVVTADDGICVNKDSVTITSFAPANAGTAAAENDSVCSGFNAKAILTGFAGPIIQWQYLDNGNWIDETGPYANDDTLRFTANNSISYRAIVKVGTCDADTSNQVDFVVTTPVINSVVSNVTRCGPGDVTLNASGTGTLSWYADSTSTKLLGTGSSYTPFVTASDTFWVDASFGLSNNNSAGLLITEMDVAATYDLLELTNVGSSPLDVTGWAIAVNLNYTTINSVNANVKILSGTLAPNQKITYSDQSSAANYWGSNIQWNPGSYPSFTGWVVLLDNNGVVRDFVAMNWLENNIQGMSTTINGFPVTIGSAWSGNGVNITSATSGLSVSRKGNSDNNSLSDWEIISSNIGTTNPNLSFPFTGVSVQSCSSPRYPVHVDVTPSPAFDVVASSNFSCAGEPVTLSVSTGLSDYDQFTWSPATGLSSTTGSSIIAGPSANTKYYSYAINNTTLCGALDSISVSVQPAPVLVLSALSENGCGNFSTTLNAVYSAQGNPASVQWSPAAGLSSTTVPSPTATVTSGDTSMYTVLITNTITGCTIRDSVLLTSTHSPDPIVTPTSDTSFCFGTVIKLAVADQSNYSTGYPSGTVVNWVGIVNGLTPQDSITSDNGTTYQAEVILPGGCHTTSAVRTVTTRSVTTAPVLTKPGCGQTNGKIVTSITGGTAPYRYIWKQGSTVLRDITTSNSKDSIVNLAPGNYTLEVADSVPYGCSSGIIPYTLNASDPVHATVSVASPVSCNGFATGVLAASYTGGTGAVTYLWSTGSNANTISNLVAGTYTVTVSDAYGCTDVVTQTLSEPAAISAQYSTTKPSCTGGNDGSISAVVTGGTTPYQIMEWYDGALNGPFATGPVYSNIPAGDYVLYVLDANSCEGILSVTLDDQVALDITTFTPASGPVGTSVTIYGHNLSGVSDVKFNTTSATVFSATSDTSIVATVPAGATTGVISVTTPCGTVSSSASFVITSPASAILNLTAMLEGYYIGGSTMNSVLSNQGVSLNTNECDSITVELHDAFSPSTTVYSAQAVLNTNGHTSLTYPGAAIGQNYYIVVNHRNSIQTWSALPVTISANTSYDFSTSASQAFGDNQKSMGGGVWAIYAGDINQDTFLGVDDVTIVDNANLAGIYDGMYVVMDVNGDGFLGVDDVTIVDNNNLGGIIVITP